MSWSWKRQSQRPKIPPYNATPPSVIAVKKVEPKEPDIEVHELHESMTRTGVHRTWNKWKGEK